jgi:hypothetical protein
MGDDDAAGGEAEDLTAWTIPHLLGSGLALHSSNDA